MATPEVGHLGGVGPGDLSYYFRALRRNAVVLLLVAGLFVVLSGLYVARTPDTYLARATVTIRVITSTPFEASVRPDILVVPATETKIATSFSLATRVAALLGKTGQEPLVARSIKATVPPKSQVMVLEYSAPSPEEAARGANAYATAYLEQRAATAQAEQAEALRRIDADVRALREELRRTSASLATQVPGSASQLDSEAYQDVLRTQLIGVRERQSAIAAMPTVPGELVTQARAPSGPAAPNGKQLMLGGLLVGLVLGVVAAFVRDRTNTRVRDAAELEAAAGLPVLGDVPSRRPWAPVLAEDVPDGAAARAYRQGSARIAHLVEDGPVDPLLVIDMGRPERACAAAVNLAVAQARAGCRTVVLLTDSSSAELRMALEATADIGLTDLVRGRVRLDEAVVESRVPRLSVLGPGVDAWALRQLRAKAPPSSVLPDLCAAFDCVVLPAPSPARDLDDVLRLARVCRPVLVAERGRTHRADVSALVADLRAVSAAAVGAVLRGREGRRPRSESQRPARRTISVRRTSQVQEPVHMKKSIQ